MSIKLNKPARDIKFRYVYKLGHKISFKFVHILALEECLHKLNTWTLISRNQFINLRDKNDKDIYEDDIVEIVLIEGSTMGDVDYYTLTGIVKFKNGCFGVNHKSIHGLHYFCQGSIQSIEVIGNIYENPELLK